MTELRRVRSVWTGFPGGPGVTTMYFLDTDTAVNELHTMWAALSNLIPADVHIQVENTGDTIEDTTGALTGTWPNSDAVAAVVGTGPGSVAGPAGASIQWKTDTVLSGHRLRGRSYIVPLDTGSYEPNGSLVATAVAELQLAADNFAGSQISSFVVWARPRDAKPADGSRPAITARVGGHGLVTSVTVADKVAVLKSRRD